MSKREPDNFSGIVFLVSLFLAILLYVILYVSEIF